MVLVAEGTGVTTEEGVVVGMAVGCGVLVLDAGLAGVFGAVGVSAAGDRDGETSGLAGAVDRAGAGVTAGS